MADSYDLEKYRNLVGEDIRKKMARRIRKTKTLDYIAVADMAKELLADLVMGNIPPEMVQEARSLLEVMTVNLAAFDRVQNDGSVGRGTAELAAAIKAASAAPPQLQATYTEAIVEVKRGRGTQVINVPATKVNGG